MMPFSSYLGFPRCEKYQAAKKLEKKAFKRVKGFPIVSDLVLKRG